MHKRKIKFCLVLFMSLGLIGVKAQSILNVKKSSGDSSLYFTSDVRKLTFSDSNLNVNEIDGKSSSYDINSIRRLDFNGLSTGVRNPLQSKKSNERLQVFPNPVNDILYLKGQETQDCELKIEIIDLQGKVLRKETFATFRGVNVSDLRRGMYLCRIYTCDKIKIIKFLKN